MLHTIPKGAKRKTDNNSPTMMSIDDLRRYFGRPPVDATGFPQSFQALNGEHLWRRPDVEVWAHERSLPDPEELRRARLPRFWHDTKRTILDIAATRAHGPLEVHAIPEYRFRVSLVAPGGRRLQFTLTEKQLRVNGDSLRETFDLQVAGDGLNVLTTHGTSLGPAAFVRHRVAAWMSVATAAAIVLTER